MDDISYYISDYLKYIPKLRYYVIDYVSREKMFTYVHKMIPNGMNSKPDTYVHKLIILLSNN